MEIGYMYDMLRSQMGRQPLFCETRPVLCDTILPDVEIQRKFILRNPVHQYVQNTTLLSMSTCNTIRAEYTNTGVRHDEGGWPRDVNPYDPEATQRYCRRNEKEDTYIHCIFSLAPEMEHYIRQNNAVNMYEAYYNELPRFRQIEQSSCRKVNIYHDDPTFKSPRPVSSICWQPEGGNQFATSYVNIDFYKVPQSSVECYIWDIENANKPIQTLTPPYALIDIQYNPKNINTVVAGMVNGQVCSFDLRTSHTPVLICPIHQSHRDLVRSVLFINAKNGVEFFSGGSDGAVKWWDLRNISEPTDEIILDMVTAADVQPTMAKANGVSALEFEPTIPTRYMVGTENGFVITGNRKGKSLQDKLPNKYDAQLGPVWKVERNPGFIKNFLTVGDWTARIWSEECREAAIMWTPFHRHRITDGAWSPTRFSLMLLTQSSGFLSVWDLLRQQRQPIFNVKVCDVPLTRIRIHENGKLFACGNTNGDIFLLELSKNLQEAGKQDKVLLTHVMERETKGERILETRMREIRVKQRKADEPSPTASIAETDAAIGDKDLIEATNEFMSIVRKELMP